MKNRILIVMAIVWAVFLFSCQREDNSISKVMDHDKNVISTYFIDDVPVSKNDREGLFDGGEIYCFRGAVWVGF